MQTQNAPSPERAEGNTQPAETSVSTVRPPRNQRPEKQSNASTQKPVPESDAPRDETDAPRKLDLAAMFKDTDDSDSDESDDPSKPVDSLNRLSKRLKMKIEDVYKIQVPMEHGESVAIGTLKDRVASMDDLETRETQFEQRRIEVEGETLRAQTFMREVLSMIPRQNLSKELVQKIEARHRANMQRERELTLGAIPSWADESKETADRKLINDHLAKWGFDPSFLNTVTDHRALKYIRDMALRDARITKALAEVEPVSGAKNNPSAKGKVPARPSNKPAANRARHEPAHSGLRTMFYGNSE